MDAGRQLIESGIMQISRHGNISARVPGTDQFLLTAGGSIDSLRPEQIALFDLEGTLLEGAVEPTSAEIVDMHSVVYRLRPEAGGVVHTHSPAATSFAVAGQPIALIYEAMARFDMTDGVPLAGYGPRGSRESVEEIEKAIRAHAKIGGVLLANHGVLAFSGSAAGAARANMVIEETAVLALNARVLGGAREIPAAMVALTQSRRDEFAAAGVREAPPR
ncbi:MAG: class II aldolase/adducin family protein [Chloroflexi bacterium]|nr:class II aldolase/adducin family protein [Chloroflexota bacterium]MDA1004321.1 class II aldolase/adducin family protein [Chloroflexota bacterium]